MSALDLIQGIFSQTIDLVGKLGSEIWESACKVVKHVCEDACCFIGEFRDILGKLICFFLSMAGLYLSPSLLLIHEPCLSNLGVKAVADHGFPDFVGCLLLPVILPVFLPISLPFFV